MRIAAIVSRRSCAIGWRRAMTRMARFLDLPLQLVDLLVGLDDLVREVRIGAQQRGDGALDDLLGAAAHLGDGAGEALQIVLEGGDDVLCHVSYAPQPKRPVM